MSAAADDIKPFNFVVSDDILNDLKARLALTRYPEQFPLPEGKEWSYGTPVNVVKDLVEYWQKEFDWRKWERTLNTKLPQFLAPIDTQSNEHGVIDVHFTHVRSSRVNAIPLLVVHGWPGNFAEVLKIVDELTEPSDPKYPAFHVVSPSLPGHGFSGHPASPGFNIKIVAKVFDSLMKKLRYSHYLAEGGDWGALVVRSLAIWHRESCRGIYTTMLVLHPKLVLRHPIILGKLLLGWLGAPGGNTAAEMGGLKRFISFVMGKSGYSVIQRERPLTLGFGMTDSPAGLLAWLREKYEAWTDNYAWTPDELLLWTMLYWIPGPTSSFRFYKENAAPIDNSRLEDMTTIISAWSPVPLGVSIFKNEPYQYPDDWGSMVQPLKYVKRYDHGGHFAAWEAPDLLRRDIQEFSKIVITEDEELRSAVYGASIDSVTPSSSQ